MISYWKLYGLEEKNEIVSNVIDKIETFLEENGFPIPSQFRQS